MRDKIVIYGNVPSKSNSYRIARNRLYKTDEVKKYESDFALQYAPHRTEMIEGKFAFIIDVYYPSMRSDIDGVFKVVLDSLQKLKAIKNDNKCQRIVANKYIDKLNPRIEFKLIEL